MLSFIVPARSQPQETQECLDSLLVTLRLLHIEAHCEFLLLDDNSHAEYRLVELFKAFRASTGQPVHIARFRQWQHYTGVFAYGLSKARGENVFFISNDMVVTPAWLRTILAVGALSPTFGIVRGTGSVVDSHTEHTVPFPGIPRSRQDFFEFAEFISRSHGLTVHEDRVLSGDAVMIKRSVIEKIGVMDRRFFGYFGDPDYGLRVRRAGFKLVCAKGAWLNHFGQGHVRADAEREKTEYDVQHQKRMALVIKAYELFRMKWDLSMPVPEQVDVNRFDWEKLIKMNKPKGYDFTPPIGEEAGLVDLL
jgi:hypothetical protein